MFRSSSIRPLLRVMLHLAVVLGIVFGPTTAGTMLAFAATSACESDCRCDSVEESASADATTSPVEPHAAVSCPDECDECQSVGAVVTAVVPTSTPLPGRDGRPPHIGGALPADAAGTPHDIFRPPRSNR